MRLTPSAFNQFVREIIHNDMKHTISHNSNTITLSWFSLFLQQWTIIHLVIKIPSCEKTKLWYKTFSLILSVQLTFSNQILILSTHQISCQPSGHFRLGYQNDAFCALHQFIHATRPARLSPFGHLNNTR